MKSAYRCEKCGKEVEEGKSCCGGKAKAPELEACRDAGQEAGGSGEPCQDYTGTQR